MKRRGGITKTSLRPILEGNVMINLKIKYIVIIKDL